MRFPHTGAMAEHDDSWCLAQFSMPNPVRISGRISSVTNSFVNGIIPVIPPTAAEVRAALTVLGMSDRVSCAYCGDTSTEWDHLLPLVVNKLPTGYISEIHNRVPACGKCNQSKGNKLWRAWMLSTARLSPNSRGVADIEQRMERLEAFERWATPTKTDFAAVVDPEVWKQHWENYEIVVAAMKRSELTAALIRQAIAQKAIAAEFGTHHSPGRD